MKPRLFVSGFALSVLGVALPAQTIDVGGTVTAIDADINAPALAVVAGTTYYPYTGISTGSGTASAINGFASLVGVLPGDLSYSFGNLDLTGYSSGGPGGFSVETYTPGVGSSFTFSVSGQAIATGEVISFVVTTNYDTGFATAVGSIHLSAPGADPDFYNEIDDLTDGANILLFNAPNLFFDLAPDINQGIFDSDGTFSLAPVPEPSSYALGAGLIVGLVACGRRRRI